MKSIIKQVMAAILSIALIVTLIPLNPATAAKKLKLSNKNIAIEVGGAATIRIKNAVKKTKVTWKASNKSVIRLAKKKSKGKKASVKVFGLSKGTAKVTAIYKQGGKKKKLNCNVTVTENINTQTPVPDNIGNIPADNKTDTAAPTQYTGPSETEPVNEQPTDEPATEAPATEVPVTETPATEAPVTEPPATEAPVIDTLIISSQSDVEEVLAKASSNSKITKIKIATDKAEVIELPEGDYSSLELLIEAPLADISNHAIFKNIIINEIADDTYREYANGNNIDVNSAGGRIIVMESALSKINILKDNSKVKVVVDGQVSAINVDAKDSEVDISGDVQETIGVNVSQKSEIRASHILDIKTQVKIDFVVYPGAENSKVSVKNEITIPNVYGVGSVQVDVEVTNDVITVVAEYHENINEQLQEVLLEGQIVDEYGYAITGAEVYVAPYNGAFSESTIMGNNNLRKTFTDESGIYRINALHTGNYIMMVKQPSMETVMQYLIITGYYGSAFHNETIRMFTKKTENRSGMIKGALYDSETRQPIEGITAKLRSGRGNTTGEVLGKTLTDFQGEYVFSDVKPGYYTVEFVDMREGQTNGKYITTSINVTVTAGLENTANTALTREAAFSQIRFVLTWGDKASGASADLDSHLRGPKVKGTRRFHTYYGNTQYYENGIIYAELDGNVITYEGPETTTIYEPVSGVYEFYVHNYSDCKNYGSELLAKSNAKVDVYKGDKLILTYYVPDDDGTVWHVCSYDGNTGEFTEKAEMTYEESSEAVGENQIESAIVLMNRYLQSLRNIIEGMHDGEGKESLQQKYEDYYNYANSDDIDYNIDEIKKRISDISAIILDAQVVMDNMSIEDIVFEDGSNCQADINNEYLYVTIYAEDMFNALIKDIQMHYGNSYELIKDEEDKVRKIMIISDEGYVKSYEVSYKDISVWNIKKEYDYYISDYGYVTITGYKGDAANAIIPDYIEGYPVIEIGPSAFSGSSIVNIELPERIDTIGYGAFSECYNLKGVYYAGSKEKWQNTYIYGDNYLFEYANIYYYARIPELIHTDKKYEFEKVKDGYAIDMSSYKNTAGSGDYVNSNGRVEINDIYDSARSQGTWELPSYVSRIKEGNLVTFRIQGYNYDDSEFRFWIGDEYFAGCTPIHLVNNVEEGLEAEGYPKAITDEEGNVLTKNQIAINADPETKAFDVTITLKAGTSINDSKGVFSNLTIKHVMDENETGHISGLVIENIYYMGAVVDEEEEAQLDLSGTEELYSEGFVSYDSAEDTVTGTYVRGLAIPLNYNVKLGESVDVTVYGECENSMRMWLADAGQHYRWSDIQNPAEFEKTYTLTADAGIENESLNSRYTCASYIIIKGESYDSVFDSIKISKVMVKKHKGNILEEDDVITLDLSKASVPSWLKNPPTVNYLNDGSVEINWNENAEDYASVTFDFDPMDISDYSYIIVDAEGDNYSVCLQDATRKEPDWGNPLNCLQCWGQSYPAKIALSISNFDELLDEDGNPADYKNIGKICFGKGTEKVSGRLVIKSVKIYKTKKMSEEPTATPTPEPTATPTPEPTATPTPEPTATPTPEPTATPTLEPTATPTPEPTATPTPEPTATPTPEPTATPTPEPTATPIPEPTATPAPAVTATPRPIPEPPINIDLSNVHVPTWHKNPSTFKYLEDGSIEINWAETAEDYAGVIFDFDPIDISEYSYIVIDAEGDDVTCVIQDATRKEPEWGNPLDCIQCWNQSYPAKIAITEAALAGRVDVDGNPPDYKNVGKISFAKGTDHTAKRLIIKSIKVYKNEADIPVLNH